MTAAGVAPYLLTIGEPGSLEDGWAARGVHSLEAMKVAAERFAGTIDWPTEVIVQQRPASLQCWGCGCGWGRKHSRNCDGDEEGFVWNWTSGPVHTVLMRNGKVAP